MSNETTKQRAYLRLAEEFPPILSEAQQKRLFEARAHFIAGYMSWARQSVNAADDEAWSWVIEEAVLRIPVRVPVLLQSVDPERVYVRRGDEVKTIHAPTLVSNGVQMLSAPEGYGEMLTRAMPLRDAEELAVLVPDSGWSDMTLEEEVKAGILDAPSLIKAASAIILGVQND